MRWFPLIISEHHVTMQLNLFWTVRCCPCFGSHVRHCHMYSHICSAVSTDGAEGVHPRTHPSQTFYHSWTRPLTSALLAHKYLSLREIPSRALFSSNILIKYKGPLKMHDEVCTPTR